MGHAHEHQEEKGQTFFYKGATGGFTAFWLLLILLFIFFLIYLG